MPALTSANIACGFPRGRPGVMRETVALARQHGVSVGAHPDFPTLWASADETFERRREVEDLVAISDWGTRRSRCRSRLAPSTREAAWCALQHGSSGRSLADAIARATAAVDRTAGSVWPAGVRARRSRSTPACERRVKDSPTAPIGLTARWCLVTSRGRHRGRGNGREPGGLDGAGPCVAAVDGSPLAARDRNDLRARRHAGSGDVGLPHSPGIERCGCEIQPVGVY